MLMAPGKLVHWQESFITNRRIFANKVCNRKKLYFSIINCLMIQNFLNIKKSAYQNSIRSPYTLFRLINRNIYSYKHSFSYNFMLTTISDKILGTELRNWVKLDREKKV